MHARFLAATKATNGVLSHYSAATLWRLVDYDENTPVHVTVTTTHTRKVPGVVVHRTRREYQVIRLDSIPTVTPARALIDLSSMQELTHQTKQLDEALAQGYVPTESELEDATHDLILTHYEPPQVQPVLVLDGIPTRPDFRYPNQALTIEADGAQFHDTPLARQDDAAKQARLEAHGDRVVRVTWDQVMTQPDQTVTRIRMAGAPRRAD